jgi:hypothetical protein
MKIILFLCALSASLVAACATTSEPVRPPVNIEIQEQVGFTITEEGRIGGDVRADYEMALSCHTCSRAGTTKASSCSSRWPMQRPS